MHSRIALDTNIFIYQLGTHAQFFALTDLVFSWLQRPGSQAVTSTITMTELLTQTYRNAAEQLVNEIYALLSTYPNLMWIAPNIAIADRAAEIRARHGLKTPDALQAATASHTGTTGFLTNDSAFTRVSAFETLVLGNLL